MSSGSLREFSTEDLGDTTSSLHSIKVPGSVNVLADSSACDFNTRLENSRLRGQVKQLQLDLKSEQDTIATLRKKLAECGKEKLDTVSRCTSETAVLMATNSNLRMDLEKREESMQQLQYEVNQLQRQLSQELQSKARREEQHAADVQALEERLEDASRRHDMSQRHYGEQQTKLAAEVERICRELEERDKTVANIRLERAGLEAERARLAELVQNQAETIAKWQDSARHIEGEIARQKDAGKRLLADLELLQSRERESNKELEAARLKVKSLEECIEAERSAHLESRFSSEIVQLKFRDLEASLEAEKQAKHEAETKVERLRSHLRDVEEAYTDERKQCKSALEKLDKAEKDFANAQRKLQTELADKRSLIAGLTEQLEVHQLDVDALKTELQRAKKKQIIMEDTYEANTKDLEAVLADFSIAYDSSKFARDSKSGRISSLLDALRHTLITNRRDLELTAEELQKLRHLCDCLTKEADTYKEALTASQAALQDAQRAASDTGGELASIKAQLSDAEARLITTTDQLRSAGRELDKERSAAGAQRREHSAIVAQLKQDTEKYSRLLQGLHQRLSTAAPLPPGRTIALPLSGESSEGDAGRRRVASPPSAPSSPSLLDLDLGSLVLEQVVMATAELQRLRAKLSSQEETERGRDELLARTRQDSEEQLSRARTAFEGREAELRRRLDEAERRCERLSEEIREKSKASQKIAADAWGKAKQSNQLQQELENECADLRAKVLLFNSHQRALHMAFALLAGAYYALAARARALAAQRKLLDCQLQRAQEFKQKVCQLWRTLSAAAATEASGGGRAPDDCRGGDDVSCMLPSNNEQHKGDIGLRRSPAQNRVQNLTPTLRFRASAIAVLAALRLRRMQRFSCPSFTFVDASGKQQAVCLGTAVVASSVDRCRSTKESEATHGRCTSAKRLISESDVLQWLTSRDLLATVVACTEDIQDVVGKMTETESFVRPGLLLTTLSNAFSKLVGRLECVYNATSKSDREEQEKEKEERAAESVPLRSDSAGLLSHALACGLRAALERAAPHVGTATRKTAAPSSSRVRSRASQHGEVLSTEAVITGLQQRTLELVRRLHASELERRRARQELAAARSELATLQTTLANCERLAAERDGQRFALQAELDRLAVQQSATVQTSTYESVCRELSEALGREQAAQRLLAQQGERLHELTARAETAAADLEAARRAKHEAEQTAACHQTIRHREEESVRQLTAQLTRLDLERKSLRDNVYEAERALRTAVRNRDIVVNYLRAVQAALQQYSSADGCWQDLPQLLLSSDLLPSDCPEDEPKAVELAACRTTVVSFAGVLQHAGLQTAAQQAELVAHRAHVARLKDELTAACQRRELSLAPRLSGGAAGSSVGSAAAAGTVTVATAKRGPAASAATATVGRNDRISGSRIPQAVTAVGRIEKSDSPLGRDDDEYCPLPLQEDSEASFLTTTNDEPASGCRSPHFVKTRLAADDVSKPPLHSSSYRTSASSCTK